MSIALVDRSYAQSTAALPEAKQVWLDPALDPDTRADLLVGQMTLPEKLQMVRSYFGALDGPKNVPPPKDALGTAGYVPGIPRLGIPAMNISDAGLGITIPNNSRPHDPGATALPAGLATAASFEPALAFAGGAMIGREAHAKGFNVLLGGAGDLVRDPRNGRNFEYAGEDPLLVGRIVGAAIRGVQSEHVISTTKHFALNDLETGRMILNAHLDERALRESDLLAFELAIEDGDPGAIMAAYNRINGAYASENVYLLTDVLKKAWHYRGFVMSDWGGVHSAARAANAGLDQESAGENFDTEIWFDTPLSDAIADGEVSRQRLDDMVHRILRSMFAKGLFDHPARRQEIDFEADAKIARGVLEAGAVLLRNKGAALPLPKSLATIAVIGGRADFGVLSGGGSSQVVAARETIAFGARPDGFPMPKIYFSNSPLTAIKAAVGHATVRYADGRDLAAAAALARDSDAAIVFVEKWASEGVDANDLALSDADNALVETVAGASRRVIVVLETGGPVKMPWLEKVGAVLEAWYPGSAGGEAIARLLFGDVDPSGHLPITWPLAESQLPRKSIRGAGRMNFSMPLQLDLDAARDVVDLDVDYNIEGADVGYKWFESRGLKPLFPFGFGLSYTRFALTGARVRRGRTFSISLNVANVGDRAGAAVPQAYIAVPEQRAKRLIGFAKVWLEPGQTKHVRIEVDRRLLAGFDPAAQNWRVAGGKYAVYVGWSAADLGDPQTIWLEPMTVRDSSAQIVEGLSSPHDRTHCGRKGCG